MANLPKISPEIIKAYQAEMSKTASPATAKRKSISLNRYFDWAQKEGHIESNPLQSENNDSTVKAKPKKNKVFSSANFIRLGILGGLVIIIFLLTNKLKFPIPFIFTPASEGVPESKIQTINNGQNQTTNGQNQAGVTPSNSASFAGNGSWNLFAKLQLTDSNGTPMVGSQSLNFKLYKSEEDTSPVWTSSPTTVNSDANGSGLVSLDGVPSDLFFSNKTLFLGFESGGKDSSARVPVSTANVPSNIGGYYPASVVSGATPETVPVISSDGSLLLASESPAIKATTGNFLIEGQAVTLKTTDGGDGNIEINPDGKGITHFLFEGTGQNYLNAQAPNLTKGSLYYGIVANNSLGTGYDLLRLQSGSKPVTRLSVDGVGNTYIGGNLNVAKDIKTAGTTRLTSGGALTNITGYSQNSGNFVINQNPGDFGSISKVGTALADVLSLTLDERGKPLTSNTGYSTLVLRRYDGAREAAALHVDEGNAIFDGQVQLGRFSTNPTEGIGEGSLIFNTFDDTVYVWNGSAWVAVGSGSTVAFDDITSGTNTTATMTVGTGASLTYSGSGTINATTLNSIADTSFLRSDTSDNFTSGTLTLDAGTTLAVNGTATFTPNSTNDVTVNLDGDSTLVLSGVGAGVVSSALCLDASNNVITCSSASSTTLQTAYNTDADGSDTIIALTTDDDSLIFRNPAASGTDSGYILSLDQLATGGVDALRITQAGTGVGASFTFSNAGTTADGLIISNSAGTLTDGIDISDATGITNAINIGPNTIIGTTANIDLSNFDVVGSSGDITTAGDIAINGGDITSSASTFNFLDNTTSKTIDIGGVTSSAADTINISTNSTAADAISIGNINTATTLGLSAGTVTISTDSTGNGEVILPNDSVGPNEVQTTSQTDEFCLTYETTGGTWEWQNCGSGATVAWNALTDPLADLTLSMTTFNTTFNWDPGADSAETNFSLTIQGEDTVGVDEDQVLLALSQTSNGVDVDEAADTLLTLTNNDSNDPVNSAIRFDAGAGGTDFTYGIDFDASTFGTAEIILSNAETISNLSDGTIVLTAATTQISGLIDANGSGTHDIAGTLNLSGNLLTSTTDLTLNPGGGQVILADVDTINIGGLSGFTYNSMASGADASDEGAISADNDLYIGGDLEVDGTIYGNITGSAGTVAWSGITDPLADLTLTMGVFNSTFNWDPGADSAETNWNLTIQGEDTVGGGDEDQVLLALSQTSNGVDVDEAADALITLANNDANDPINSGIRFDAGAAGTDFTFGINFDLADIGTAEIVLENAEQINNQTDGTITLEDGSGTDFLSLNVTTATFSGDIILSDDNFIGLGSSSGLIEFDDQSTDEVNILNALVGIGTQTPDRTLNVETNTATTNGVTYQERLTSMTSGTAAAGIGAGLEFETEDSAGNGQVAAAIDGILTKVTSTTEQGALVIRTADQGSTTLNEAARFTNQGDMVTNGHVDIASTSNASDIYTYDTTKDLDGGLWRNDDRAKASSWYNEGKDDTSANCDITTMDRCGRNDFPEKAFIVATGSNVYIYDAKDNYPWMRFDQGTDFALGVDTNNNPSAVFAQNGKIYIGTNGAAASGAYIVDLRLDKITRVNTTDARDFLDTIDGRNADPGTAYPDQGRTGLAIVNIVINDIHARTINFTNGSTVGGNGESYIAVATDDGVSLVKETDQLTFDFVETAGDNYNQVWIDQSGNIWATNTTIDALEKWTGATNQASDQTNASSTWDETTTPALTNAVPSIQIAPSDLYVTEGTSTVDGRSPTVYLGTDLGITALNTKVGDETNGSVKYYTNSYITEEMTGDTRGMWGLHDTDTDIDTAETTADLSVKGETLTASNTDGVGFTSVTGIRGEGVTFDGTDDFFTCTDANCGGTTELDPSSGSFSIGAWINTTRTTRQMFVAKGSSTGQFAYSFESGRTNAGSPELLFYNTADGVYIGAVSTLSIADGRWHYVAGTYDGTTVSVYIDGDLAASSTSKSGSQVTDSTGDFFVGARNGSSPFLGSMDEPYVTAEGLTISQVKRLYQVGLRAQQNHTASRISGVTGVDTYQQLLGNGTNGVSSTSRVFGVAVDSSSQFLYAGLNDGSGATGGLSTIGIDSDSAVDLYSNSVNTTKVSDAGTTFDASDITAFSVTGTPCSIGYNSGSTNCQSQITLGIAGEASGGTTTSWMETTDYSLYAALAQLTSPDSVRNNITVNNVFQVFNTVNNLTDSTTVETIQTPSFSVDSSGYVVYNYLGAPTGVAWDINDALITTGTLFDISSTAVTTGKILSITAGSALTTGSGLSITSATYSPAAAETGSLVNLSLTDTAANTSGNSIVNGINVATTLNTTGATGTKEFNGINIAAPTFTGCSGGACTWSGLKVNATTTASGITEIGLGIGNVTGGAGTETALSVGSGWDTDLSFVDTSPIIASGNGFTLSFSDGTQSEVEISDQGTTARLAVSDSLQAGGLTTVAYSRFGTASATHSGNLTVSNDVLVSGDLELDGVLYLDGENISDLGGTATITFAVTPTSHDNYNVLTNGGWLVENPASGHPGIAALMVNQARDGSIFAASAAGTNRFLIANNGTTTITTTNAGTVASLVVNSGTGKIDVGTVDPPYTINGKKYSTFLSGIIGVKEEVAGQVDTNQYVAGLGYRHVIDFNNLPEGSDLWLFSKATNIKENIDKLVALLTPENPTKVWYDIDRDNKRIVIYSARPTRISYRLTGPRFDYQDWSNIRPDDQPGGFSITNIDVFNSNPIAQTIQNMSDFTLQEIQSGFYILRDSSGTIVDGFESIGSFVAGNIKSGAIQSQEIATQAFTAAQATIDNLLVTSGLVSPTIETSLISPIADGTDVGIQIGNANGDHGELSIQNGDNEEVASIDSEGNATFSGELIADSVASNDIIAGKIYADEIVARNGNFINTNTSTLTGVSREEIEDLLEQVAQDQDLLHQASTWNLLTATDSASLDEIAVSDLYVTDQAAINSLSVTTSIAVGTDLAINALDNSFNSLSAPLKIQSLALAPVEIMNGKITIDTNGDVTINGNLYVAGQVQGGSLSVNDGNDEVASIDASGLGQFSSIATKDILIAGAESATTSGTISGDIQTNSTVGKGIIPTGSDQITITNPKVTDYTLIYVTPTSSTENQVLYVKNKSVGSFSVGFTNPIGVDANFNWWIVETSQ